MTTIKVFLALASIFNWHLIQLDVNNAFLHGDLDEELYMHLPLGYLSKGEKLLAKTVCKLHRSLYGLKQVSRQWFSKFSIVLLENGFIQSSADCSLFIKTGSSYFLALLVYVDDIIIISNALEEVRLFKVFLNEKFKLKDLGNLKFFLGLEVARNKTGISVSQRHYALKLLEETGMLSCKSVTTPMDANIKITREDGDILGDATQYRKLIGKLLYLSITRPDITYSVNYLSQFIERPRTIHLKAT